MTLFEFKLKDLVDVMPWDDENGKKLHWFGLTDGYFYMNVNGEQLFHSTDEIIEYWKNENPEFAPVSNYVDYQVVRSYEDLLYILPNVLQPIPTAVFKHIETFNKQVQFENIFDNYLDFLGEDDEPGDEYFDATEWFYLRRLSTMHLNQGPDIWFLLHEDQILIRWNNKEKHENGIPLWTSTSGECRMKADSFIEEVNGFHNNLMLEMERRIDLLHKNNPIPDIRIDLKRLSEEHQERKLSLARTLASKPTIKNWDIVQSSINKIFSA